MIESGTNKKGKEEKKKVEDVQFPKTGAVHFPCHGIRNAG